MKHLLIALICAIAVMWWSGGSWGWGAAAMLFGWAAAWVCSPEAR